MKIAAVQARPVWMNRAATIDKVVASINEAATHGANLVAFPETLVPGYPWWAAFDNVSGLAPWTRARQAIYLDQAVHIAAGHLDAVVQAANQTGCLVMLGVAELSESQSSVYCSLVTIHPDDGIVGVHRKLKPTTAERVCWAEGDGNGLRVHQHGDWRIGGLNCFENWLPLPRFALYSQAEQIHIATWPGGTSLTNDISRFIAREGGVYVVSVGGLFAPDDIPADYPGRDQFAAAHIDGPIGDGGTLIVAPTGQIIAQAEKHTEQIIYAEADATTIHQARYAVDVSGHYHRPDIFRLEVDRTRHHAVHFND